MALTQEIICNSLLYIAAFVLVAHVLVPFAWLLVKHCILARLCIGRRRWLRSRRGAWAAVTGATDGIGRSYAFALAADGLNVILISRTESKLKQVAKEISDKHGVKIETIVADFVRADIYEQLQQKLSNYELACVVNNVGMGPPHPNVFVGDDMFDMELFSNMLNTNCLSMMRMTRIAIEIMRKSQAGGVIINVGSASGIQPVPLINVYSSTKAFANFFSSAVASELQYNSQRIHIHNVLPMFVATKMSGLRKTSFFVPSPDRYLSEALNLLGVEETTIGCFGHAIQKFISGLIPSWLNAMLAWKMLNDGKRRILARRRTKEQ